MEAALLPYKIEEMHYNKKADNKQEQSVTNLYKSHLYKKVAILLSVLLNLSIPYKRSQPITGKLQIIAQIIRYCIDGFMI